MPEKNKPVARKKASGRAIHRILITMKDIEQIPSRLSRQKMEKDAPKIDQENEKESENDVILTVPQLKVDSLKMDAENISFSISVKAQLTNLSNVEIGTNIHIEKINLDLNSLDAEALFQVKLKKIEAIFLKALDSLDQNPKVMEYAKKNNNE